MGELDGETEDLEEAGKALENSTTPQQESPIYESSEDTYDLTSIATGLSLLGSSGFLFDMQYQLASYPESAKIAGLTAASAASLYGISKMAARKYK